MEITPELQPTSKELTPMRNRAKAPVVAREEIKSEVVDRKDLHYQWKKGREKVRGRFVNDETPGETKEFVTRFFKQDPVEQWKLKDQGIYELPLIVAQHLNEDGKTPIYGAAKDEEGNPIEIITGWKKRFHFESLEFTQIGGFGREPQLDGGFGKPMLQSY